MTCRRGVSLLDMLVVIAGLSVLMTLGAVMLVNLKNLQSAIRNDEEQVRYNTVLADRLRRDAGQAIALLDKEGGYQAGADCTILKLPGERVVVWRLQSNEAIRREFGRKESDQRTSMQIGGEGASAAFVPDPSRRLVALTLFGMRDQAGRKPARVVEIVAAVGGDRP